ncbi:MAG: hypothetical protein ABJL54_11910 [Halioglobus sp.]
MTDKEFPQGVDYPRPFDELAVELCRSASRYVSILSPRLDHAVFDQDELSSALSALARGTRQSEVRILVTDSRGLIGRGHRLLALARRIPSLVQIRKLEDHPDWNGQTVIIRDRDGVLYKSGSADREGFYEPDSRVAAEKQLELFNELWRYSVQDPELRNLSV